MQEGPIKKIDTAVQQHWSGAPMAPDVPTSLSFHASRNGIAAIARATSRKAAFCCETRINSDACSRGKANAQLPK
jgi:hypothetical protein